MAGVIIGRHTYGLETLSIHDACEESKLIVGNFCSFAKGVQILCKSEHPLNYPSTFPFRTLLTHKDRSADQITKGDIVIESDVWVGLNAIILSGSHIGTGAVIGAGCVVRGNVEPYAIMIGNPMQLLRYRFDAPTREILLASKWWEKSDEEIAELDEWFYTPV
jgi:acetyltransferase-like isoleucine patch superfamily enzyme